MTDFLLDAAFAPFTFALALLVGLLGLEVVALLLGGSLMGGDSDADLDAPVGGEMEGAELTGLDLGDLDLDALELEGAEAPTTSGGGVLGWLGIGKVPLLIWLAAWLMAFGLAGIGGQMVLREAFAVALPAGLAAIPAALLAFWFARGFGSVFARLLPKNETQALSETALGRRRGVVTQGTAARGRPAEVRVRDGYGNAHYLRAEPLNDQEQIASGTEVLVIRDRRAKRYVLVPLSE